MALFHVGKAPAGKTLAGPLTVQACVRVSPLLHNPLCSPNAFKSTILPVSGMQDGVWHTGWGAADSPALPNTPATAQVDPLVLANWGQDVSFWIVSGSGGYYPQLRCPGAVGHVGGSGA